MPILTSDQITSRIKDFLRDGGTCLFAGAGVGCRAGKPSWIEYLNYLADIAEEYEPETAALMRLRIKTNYFLEAAYLYKSCIGIPNGVKWEKLAKPFVSDEKHAPQQLRALMTLPFSAVVTTNFDRSLHDAYCMLYEKRDESGLPLKAPQYVELGDPSMKYAIFWNDFFIARIHGRAEIPESMVLDNDDYKRAEKDLYYNNFVLHILKNYRCLWVGFSFVDPAIQKVFDLIRELLPPNYQPLHLALIPSDTDPKLTMEFNKYNIETATYDSTNNHNELWKSIGLAQRDMRTLSRQAPNKIENIPGLRRFIATCYARLKMGKKAEPLLEIIAQGIVAQIIFETDQGGISKKELIQRLQQYFNMVSENLVKLVDVITEKLIEKGICFETDGNNLARKPDNIKSFNNALTLLVQGVIDRLKVREGITATSKLRSSIEQIINDIFLSRGWDLGAHFAGSNLSSNFDAWTQIQNLLIDYSKRMSISNTDAVGNAILDLFRHPTEKECVFLTDIGRVAFGVELILSNAQSATSDNLFLPKRIYLDANVLMPAIVEGHPYCPVYADTIGRLQEATASMGDEVHVLTAKEFLNEIVTHRRIAIQEVKSNGLENKDKLMRHILFYGRENTNVYISAYASLRNNEDGNLSFFDFLSRVAPYNTEEALSDYLKKRGINTIELLFNTSIEKETFREYKIELQNAYDDMISSEVYPGEKGKAKVLIEHEAGQLARLMLDIKSGRKPIFVSADKRLFRLCKGPVLGQCASALISHLGLIQLVDLVVGIDTNKKALSHLIWDVGLSDERITIRNYLIDLALQHYDEVKAKATWEIVDKISAKASEQAKAEGVNLFSKKEKDVAASAIFIDRFENDFYKNMAEVIKKREEET